MLGFNSFGLPFFYWAKIQICKIKAEYAEREVSEKTLILISSEKKGLQLINSRELQADGKMYDIVKTRTRNGVKYFYATSDQDEDAYINKLADVEKGDSGTNSLPVKMFKLYEVKYVAAAKSYDAPRVPYHHITDFCVANTPFICPSPIKDILSPPPDPVFS